jgi:ribonuclease P protein component
MKTTKKDAARIGSLLKRADYLRLQGMGKKWVTPHFILQMAPMPPEGGGGCRFGQTIPKKIWKNATDRNRVRRRLRALVLDVLAPNPPMGVDLVLLPRSSARLAPREVLEKDLRWALKRLLGPEKGKNDLV